MLMLLMFDDFFGAINDVPTYFQQKHRFILFFWGLAKELSSLSLSLMVIFGVPSYL